MHATFSVAVGRSRPQARIAPLLPFLLVAACGGSSGDSGQSGIPGELAFTEDGDPFIIDENQSGSGADFHLDEVSWGRLVDVYDVDGTGTRNLEPVFRDYAIDPLLETNPALGFFLDRNPATQRERLTIQNPFGADPADPLNGDLFVTRLEVASELPLILPKDDDGAPPFTLVPRNACMVLRFDDCLKDDATAVLNLATNVKVFTGYAPTTPFQARLFFDPNHGALISGMFHSTRVVADLSVSAAEAADSNLVANAGGLPASLGSSTAANVSVRIPTEIDIGSSQFQTLTNLSGIALDVLENAPVDPTVATMDVVRAMRSGNQGEPDDTNGFLSDEDQPKLVGGWSIEVTGQTPVGTAGFDFLLDLTFQSVCQADPLLGDVIEVGGAFLEVTAPGVRVGNSVNGLPVRSVEPLVDDGDPLTDDVLPEDLVDPGTYQTPFDPDLFIDDRRACWVSFLPAAGAFPAGEVLTSAQFAVRFSEPMDPASLSPFGGYLVVNGPEGTTPDSQNLVVGSVLPDPDLRVFTFDPDSSLAHVFNVASPFLIQIGNATDLGGRPLLEQVVPIPFTLDPLEAQVETDAIVLRFDSATNDEYEPEGDPGLLGDGMQDLRGQFVLQPSRGVLLGRQAAHSSWPVDRTRLVPSRHFPFPQGIFTPLTPLGSKLQTVWRHCDMGWHPADETKINIDVVGLNWSPVGGLVMTDFYDLFEIRLGHSRFLPDELCCGMPPLGGTSGLPPGPSLFEDNYLDGSNPSVVHNRALGYTISVADVFSTPGGTTPLIPFPLNRGFGPDVTYTWRDTAILTLGADGDPTQPGFPLAAEVGTPALPPFGSLGGPGAVPSYGLPLLIEIKCFPSDQGIGLNRFDINFGTLSGAPIVIPGFRAYSAGGRNGGLDQFVLPDSETVPRGNANPGGNLPSADAVFYLGQLDTVVRISRVHTVWLDAGLNIQPLWKPPVFDPAVQPTGTSIQVDYRGASGFQGDLAKSAPFDASLLDPYGDPIVDEDFAPQQLTPLDDWSSQIVIGNGLRYLQLRITFVNNIATGVGPELSAIALPYEF